MQQAYLRLVAEQERDPRRILKSSPTLERLASLVATGYKIAAGGDEPGAAGCGVREPRVPSEPLLTAASARSLPTPNAPDQSFWRI